MKRHCKVQPEWIGKQQKWEAEGMESIIGLWRSEAINCGEKGGLKKFTGKSSDRIWLARRWWEKKLPAERWNELRCVICTIPHRCFLSFVLRCHQVICQEARLTEAFIKPFQDLFASPPNCNTMLAPVSSNFVAKCEMSFRKCHTYLRLSRSCIEMNNKVSST